jgi:hypothetical protein
LLHINLKGPYMKDIYTSPVAALKILEERRSSISIRERVAEYLGNILPNDSLELGQPAAILARYVPRATGEDLAFAEISQEAGFKPYWASYKADKFTTRNPEKVETIRPPIWWQKGQRTRAWVVEPDKRSGGIGELQTIYGNSSTEYQRNLREAVFAEKGMTTLIDNCFDMGDWYKSQAPRFGYETGNLAPFYYLATMALATTFGALYEDFDGGPNANSGDLALFRNNVVYPAIDRVKHDLGLKPIIVRMPFQRGMNETDLSFLDDGQAAQFKNVGFARLESVTVEDINE